MYVGLGPVADPQGTQDRRMEKRDQGCKEGLKEYVPNEGPREGNPRSPRVSRVSSPGKRGPW